MSDEYLWDKSGEPDPEIAKLEHALAPLAHTAKPFVVPDEGAAIAPAAPTARSPRLVAWRERPALPRDLHWLGLGTPAWTAIAASLLVVAGFSIWAYETGLGASWRVASLEGRPRVGTRSIQGNGRLAVGEWLETDGGSRARVDVGGSGQIVLEPSSRLRLVRARPRAQRLALERGGLLAVITAPPRRFSVDTPGATAVDLGCAYTLEVEPSGAALVTVLVGWVSFESEGRESFIPAGARCATRPGYGPSTPYFTDASAAFKNALVTVDLSPSGSPEQRAALGQVLDQARREDALTLWHLLQRVPEPARSDVFERLAALAPPPAGVTREGVLRGERAMLDRWWEGLGYGETQWWRLWKSSWPKVS